MKIEDKGGKIYIDGLDIMKALKDFEKECERLNKENCKLKEAILNETTTFCNECASKECCHEEECVLWRIEQLADKRENGHI